MLGDKDDTFHHHNVTFFLYRDCDNDCFVPPQITISVGDYRDKPTLVPSEASFVEHQGNMVKHLKKLATNAQDMVGKSNTKPKELGGIAQNMVKNYNALTDDTKLAIRATNQPEVNTFILFDEVV